jgi:hypothetical protein
VRVALSGSRMSSVFEESGSRADPEIPTPQREETLAG